MHSYQFNHLLNLTFSKRFHIKILSLVNHCSCPTSNTRVEKWHTKVKNDCISTMLWHILWAKQIKLPLFQNKHKAKTISTIQIILPISGIYFYFLQFDLSTSMKCMSQDSESHRRSPPSTSLQAIFATQFQRVSSPHIGYRIVLVSHLWSSVDHR